MSSIRVSPDLLQRLHQATPPGVSLPLLIERLLEEAGGPEEVRGRLAEIRGAEAAKAKVARLRNRRHRSVVLEPGQQVLLAEATLEQIRFLERTGQRRPGPKPRSLVLGRGARPPARDRSGIRMERSGGSGG